MGVISTAVGYEGGFTPNPSYEEVCSGRTGHAESVRVVFDARRLTEPELVEHADAQIRRQEVHGAPRSADVRQDAAGRRRARPA